MSEIYHLSCVAFLNIQYPSESDTMMQLEKASAAFYTIHKCFSGDSKKVLLNRLICRHCIG